MADQRIQYTEEMVGNGHPTKPDTLNRHAAVEHNTDGAHKDITSYVSAATTILAGKAELATNAEALNGSDPTRIVTPDDLKYVLDQNYGAYPVHEISEFPDDHTAAGLALLDDADAAAQRTTLGLGSMATQNANNVSVSGGSISGITDLAVADGGTGSSTPSAARTALGLAIGADVMAYEAWSIHEITESGE